MNIRHAPIFIIGVMFIFIGLEIAFAPGIFVYTQTNTLYLDVLGRVPTGLTTLLVGLLTAWEGWRGSKGFCGLYAAFLMCLFFVVVNILPLWMGNRFLPFGPFVFKGFINGTAVIVWAAMSVLIGHFYITTKLDK